MKMADMRMTKSEKKETAPCSASNTPDYPWGLQLRLDNAALEKLGIESLPKVGGRVVVHGEGVITAVSQHESKSRDDRNVEIQIQELGVESAPATAKERNELARADFSSRLDAEKKRRA